VNRSEVKPKILNIGIAFGATSEMLAHFGHVTSLEYDKECVDFVNSTLSIAVEPGTILDLPYEDAQFDIVCAFDVIEHVEDHHLAIQEMKRVSKLGGSIIVTVPALKIFWSHHDVVNHHYRRYSGSQLKELIHEPAFITYFNFFLSGPILMIRLFRNISDWINPKENELSDFERIDISPNLDAVFFRIFRAEKALIGRKIRLPIGVSLLAHWINK